jgi:hypothetical protein
MRAPCSATELAFREGEGVRAEGFEPPRPKTPGPKLPTRCAGWWSPGLYQAFELGRCRRSIASCNSSSRGVAARPVSNLVSTGGLRSRPVADASGAPVLRASLPLWLTTRGSGTALAGDWPAADVGAILALAHGIDSGASKPGGSNCGGSG